MYIFQLFCMYVCMHYSYILNDVEYNFKILKGQRMMQNSIYSKTDPIYIIDIEE